MSASDAPQARYFLARLNKDELRRIGDIYVKNFTVLEKSPADFVQMFLEELNTGAKENIWGREVFTPEEGDTSSQNIRKLLDNISDAECVLLYPFLQEKASPKVAPKL